MKITYKIIFLAIGIGLYSNPIEAQSNYDNESDSLPIDKSIRYGRLENGFTYYLKPISQSWSGLYLKFLVKAGSNNQDSDQLNIAHAVEHMGFKASEHFPSGIYNETELLDKIGLRKLKDLPAHSSYYFTEYNLNIPPQAHIEKGFDIGLLWFKDIATGLKLLEEEIDGERGILKEEFILRKGKTDLNTSLAELSLDARLFPCRMDKYNFFEHNETFSAKSLRRFYKDWYRPDLMALSVVGDFDPDIIEKQIKKVFSGIKAHKIPRTVKDCDSLFYFGPSRFAIVEVKSKSDQPNSIKNKSVEFKLLYRDFFTKENLHNWKGLKRLSTWKLLIYILNSRFQEATETYGSSFNIFSKYPAFGKPYALEITISTDNNMEQVALKEAVQILHQMKKYGVNSEELEEAKEKLFNPADSTMSKSAEYWKNEILKHYIVGEAIPIKKEKYIKDWITNLSLKEYNNIVQQFISQMPDDMGIMAPTGHAALNYSEERVRSWIRDVYKNTIAPYKLPETPTSLISLKVKKKLKMKAYKDNGIGESGAKELVLNNGVKVILKSYKPDGILEDKILLHGFSPNGASCFPKKDYFSAMLTPDIVRNSGVRELNKFQLKRFLSAGSQHLLPRCQVSPYVGYQESGISGEAALRDLETMLQLVYLYFTKPRKDTVAFEDWKLQEQKFYQNPSYKMVDVDFRRAIREITGDHFADKAALGAAARNLKGTKRFDGIKEVKLNSGYEIYQKLFGNADDFTFLISGEFPIDSIIPLVNKYLGNLPNISNLSCVSSPLKIKYSSKIPLKNEISTPGYYEMHNVNYGLRFIKETENLDDWQEQIKVKALGIIAGQKAWDLRFEKGYGLYLVGGFGQFNNDMMRYEIGFNFTCPLADLPLIQKESKKIISELKSGDFEKEFESAVKSILSKSIHAKKRANQPWAMREKLYEHYRYGQPLLSSPEFEHFVKSLSTKDIVGTANKYLDEKKLYEFVMED